MSCLRHDSDDLFRPGYKSSWYGTAKQSGEVKLRGCTGNCCLVLFLSVCSWLNIGKVMIPLLRRVLYIGDLFLAVPDPTLYILSLAGHGKRPSGNATVEHSIVKKEKTLTATPACYRNK